jgi:hypothetical protein
MRATRPKSARREAATSQTQPISSIRETQTYIASRNRSSFTAQTNNIDRRQSISCGTVANLQIKASSAHINFQTACPLNPQTRQPQTQQSLQIITAPLPLYPQHLTAPPTKTAQENPCAKQVRLLPSTAQLQHHITLCFQSKRLTTIGSHARAHPTTPKSNNQIIKTDKNIRQANARATHPKSARREPTTSTKQNKSQASVQHKHTAPNATEAAPLPKPTTLTGVDRSVVVLSPICKSKHRQRT